MNVFTLFADESEQVSPDEDDDDEVRKLKVCIELKGLRLSKPAATSAEDSLAKQERVWPQPHLVAQSIRDRKIRAGEPEDKADINRKWACDKLVNGKNEPPVTQSAEVFLSSSRVTEIYLRLALLFLVACSVFGGFPMNWVQRN